jgi:3',5'-cyclic AMP phosphodiesterase CpdA
VHLIDDLVSEAGNIFSLGQVWTFEQATLPAKERQMNDPTQFHDDHSPNGATDSDVPQRRTFLKCMAWAGAGTLWLMKGGVLHAETLDALGGKVSARDASFSFVQISDSHIGFNKAPNPDVVATLQQAIGKINAQKRAPDFVIHTGDLTHLSKPEEFDTVAEVMKSAKTKQTLFVPGEHDVIGDNGKEFFRRFGTGNTGWYSYDYAGAHFVALVNVLNLQAGGLGRLGQDQLDWLKKDLAGHSASTPIVVFAHMPMWDLYPQWGWGTDDSAQAMTLLKRFGSVTVLNGHIHQIQQKVEGNITFHTARSTAYPQPAAGVGPGPGPMKDLGTKSLASYIGVRSIQHVRGSHDLAVTEQALG